MKIRQGFVSNSSSSSYIIALARNYKATKEQIQKFADEIADWEDEDYSFEQADEQIKTTVEALCSTEGKNMWFEDSPVQYLGEFIDMLEDDYILGTIDGSSGSGQVTNILADGNREKVTAKVKKIMEALDEN